MPPNTILSMESVSGDTKTNVIIEGVKNEAVRELKPSVVYPQEPHLSNFSFLRYSKYNFNDFLSVLKEFSFPKDPFVAYIINESFYLQNSQTFNSRTVSAVKSILKTDIFTFPNSNYMVTQD